MIIDTLVKVLDGYFFALIQLEIKNVIAYNEFRQFLLSNLFYTNVVILFPTRKIWLGFLFVHAILILRDIHETFLSHV